MKCDIMFLKVSKEVIMKFIHIADMHFDTPLLSLKNNRELIKKRRTEYKQVFRDVIQLCKKEEVELLFVSGDLFEHKFVQRGTIEFIISSFQLIPNTKIFIAPGNHDPYIKSSPYTTYEWPENVTIFTDKIGMFSVGNVNIYGIGFNNFEFMSDEISKIEMEDNNKINIFVAHGTLNGSSKKYLDIKSKDVEKFDYVALGHIHEKKVDDSHLIYPGSLVSMGFDELGEHGLVIGNLEKNNITYEFRNMENRHFIEYQVDISDFKSPDEILNHVTFEDNFYRVILSGSRNVSIEKVKEILNEQSKNICDIKDLTHIAYDFEKIATEQNLKGYFTKKMLEEMKQHPEQKEEILHSLEITYQLM